MRRQENKVHHNQAQLASGKAAVAKWWPVSDALFTRILVSNQSSNSTLMPITLVETALKHEVMIANSEGATNQNEPWWKWSTALSPEDRLAKKREIQELNNFLYLATLKTSLATTFAGTKPKLTLLSR